MQAREEEKAMKLLLGRILRMKEAMGFEAWSGYVQRSQDAERVSEAKAAAVRKVVANVISVTAARGLRQWRDATKAVEQEAAIAAERAKMADAMARATTKAQHKEIEVKLRRVIRSMFAAQLRKGWYTWRQKELTYVQAKKKLATARKALARILLAAQASAWNGWIEVVAQAREKEKAMKLLLGRILRMKEAMGFVAWSHMCSAAKRQSEFPMQKLPQCASWFRT